MPKLDTEQWNGRDVTRAEAIAGELYRVCAEAKDDGAGYPEVVGGLLDAILMVLNAGDGLQFIAMLCAHVDASLEAEREATEKAEATVDGERLALTNSLCPHCAWHGPPHHVGPKEYRHKLDAGGEVTCSAGAVWERMRTIKPPHWHDTDDFIRLRDARVAKLAAGDAHMAIKAPIACTHLAALPPPAGWFYLENFRRGDAAFLCKACAEHQVECQLLTLSEMPSE